MRMHFRSWETAVRNLKYCAVEDGEGERVGLFPNDQQLMKTVPKWGLTDFFNILRPAFIYVRSTVPRLLWSWNAGAGIHPASGFDAKVWQNRFFFHLFIVKTSLVIRQPSVHVEGLRVDISLDACAGINIKVSPTGFSKQSDSSDLFPFHPSISAWLMIIMIQHCLLG